MRKPEGLPSPVLIYHCASLASLSPLVLSLPPERDPYELHVSGSLGLFPLLSPLSCLLPACPTCRPPPKQKSSMRPRADRLYRVGRLTHPAQPKPDLALEAVVGRSQRDNFSGPKPQVPRSQIAHVFARTFYLLLGG